MSRLVFSELSLRDLEALLDYIAIDRPEAAVRFVDELRQQCELLAAFPGIGAARDDLAPNLRVFSHRGYTIYFRRLGDQVRVERVLHGAMDVGRIKFD